MKSGLWAFVPLLPMITILLSSDLTSYRDLAYGSMARQKRNGPTPEKEERGIKSIENRQMKHVLSKRIKAVSDKEIILRLFLSNYGELEHDILASETTVHRRERIELVFQRRGIFGIQEAGHIVKRR